MYPQNNYNYYQQQQPQQMYGGYMQQQMPQQALLKGRPVSSIDEVKAANIDFDGSVFYFPDLANKKIYTKQINMDGTSSLLVYNLEAKAEQPEYITREEFEKVIQALKSPQEKEKINF